MECKSNLLCNGLAHELRVRREPVHQLARLVLIEEGDPLPHDGRVQPPPQPRGDVLSGDAHEVHAAEVAGAAQQKDARQSRAKVAQAPFELLLRQLLGLLLLLSVTWRRVVVHLWALPVDDVYEVDHFAQGKRDGHRYPGRDEQQSHGGCG